MKQDKVLQVCYEDQTVGTLAMTADHKVAFQYSDEWLETGFSINPFSLPLQKQVFVPLIHLRSCPFPISYSFLRPLR